MKKLTAFLLTAILALSLTACGGETNNGNQIGDTVETDYYNITLKDAAFTNNILVCYGDDASQVTFTKAEELFTPSYEPFVDEDGYFIDGVHCFSVGSDTEDVYLYYDLNVEFTGTEARSAGDYDLAPIVSYGDYMFDSDYMSFYRVLEDDIAWYNFNAGFDNISLVRALGLEIGYFNGTFEPLSEPIEIRGVAKVPKTVAEDTETGVTISFAGAEFVVR